MTDPRKKPPMVLPNYPYMNRFTPEQLNEAMDRKDRILETLMDPVGPDGTLINLPIDMLHILAFHQAFAGVDVHTDGRQLIESRVTRDESQMFELYQWRPRGDFGDQPAEVDTDGEAETIAAQMKQQLTPQVRAALATILADELAAAAPGTAASTREHAESVLIEHRMKGSK